MTEINSIEAKLIDSFKLCFYDALAEEPDPEQLEVLPSQLKAIFDLKDLSDCAGHACDNSWDFESFLMWAELDDIILKAWQPSKYTSDFVERAYHMFLNWCAENEIAYTGPTGRDFDT